MLTIKNLYLKKGSPSKKILNGLSVNFPQGEISLLMGKSGREKVHLMRCMAQLEHCMKVKCFLMGRVYVS